MGSLDGLIFREGFVCVLLSSGLTPLDGSFASTLEPRPMVQLDNVGSLCFLFCSRMTISSWKVLSLGLVVGCAIAIG